MLLMHQACLFATDFMAYLFSTMQRSLKQGLFVLVPMLIGLAVCSPAQATPWDRESLTVPGSPDGAEITFTENEISSGRKVFNSSCGTCHAGGITKTNHNVGLDPETLALATPARDNINALVDYMRDPTSYDGEYSISDLHPSKRSSELYPVMRNLNEEDLRLMAGYILVAPKVQGTAWGGGKVYF